MSTQFPPSSPVKARKPPLNDLESSPLRPKDINVFANRSYPTPIPSSSVPSSDCVAEFTSSPVKPSIVSRANLADSVIIKNGRPSINARKVIPLPIDPSYDGEIRIGRNSKLSDFVVPHVKTVSRHHASFKYTHAKHRLELKCVGMNGIIVTLPGITGIQLYQVSKDAYELDSNLLNDNDDAPGYYIQTDKHFQFLLQHGETVNMPFVHGTLLNFRASFDVKLRLSINHESFTPKQSITHYKITPKTPEAPRKKAKYDFKPSQGLSQSTAVHTMDTQTTPTRNKMEKVPLNIVSPEKAPCNSSIITQLHNRGIDILEMQKILSNHLAFANIQQTPLYQLGQANKKTQQLTKDELLALLQSCKCIGVIYRQGTDASGKPLDPEFFYDIDNDEDADRRQLVESLKGGRSGIRSCRKTHKQYFWKKPK